MCGNFCSSSGILAVIVWRNANKEASFANAVADFSTLKNTADSIGNIVNKHDQAITSLKERVSKLKEGVSKKENLFEDLPCSDNHQKSIGANVNSVNISENVNGHASKNAAQNSNSELITTIPDFLLASFHKKVNDLQ